MNAVRLVCAASAAVATVSAASADTVVATYHFGIITSNGVPANANGGAVLSVDVIEIDANAQQAAFQFYFASAYDMSMTEIYFDDNGGVLDSINSITDSGAGVAMSSPASPGDLPSGNPIDFDADFSAGSSGAPDGVDAVGEWVRILFDLDSGKDVNDVLAALGVGLTDPFDDVAGGLRIGLHVQSFADGESESFVTTTLVPLPPAAWAGLASLAGLAGVGYVRRRSLRT